MTELASGDAERLVTDMREALVDPVFGEGEAPLADLRLVATNAPALARSFLELHRAYRQSHEQLASLDEALGRDDARAKLSPWEEVRDFFHYCDNYIDSVDRAAERFASKPGAPADIGDRAVAALQEEGAVLRLQNDAPIRNYDVASKILTLSAKSAPATRRFQLLHQVALNHPRRAFGGDAGPGRGSSRTRRAASPRSGWRTISPEPRFCPMPICTAPRSRCAMISNSWRPGSGASVEQVAHRLSTLQRPNLRGIPFFFVVVDQAGTITKRHSATRLQFARFGGACPLWNVHRAFETPGRLLRQLAETPTGTVPLPGARRVKTRWQLSCAGTSIRHRTGGARFGMR